MKVGVVIPSIENRLPNLTRVLEALNEGTVKPEVVIPVCDGWIPKMDILDNDYDYPIIPMTVEKHQPGKEQPRNTGVRFLDDNTDCDYVWFLDSDVVPATNALAEYKRAFYNTPMPRVLVGPYDFLDPGQEPDVSVKQDMRWAMFEEHSPEDTHIGKLNVGLGTFGGNIMFPIEVFKKTGGYWKDLHMGRCEDGELGIRLTVMNIPIGLVAPARGYHIWHEINLPEVLKKNERDVPMINERHPWIESQGVMVADEDGKRFEIICDRCGEQINTLLMWEHEGTCQGRSE